jgi:hypothetical protein
MTSQVRMTIVIRTGEGNTPKVTPDRFSPATRAAEVDEANRTRAGAPLRGAVIAYRITRRIITGRGAQLYLQFPWSWELRNGWGLSGMFTEFIRPGDPTSKLITEATFVIEKNVTERASLSSEYVGDYPENGNPCPTIELGRTVSPQSNSAGGFPRRPGAQPQRAQLHCGHQIFGIFR